MNSSVGVVDQHDYRRALGCFATGVTVITTRKSNGELLGITANSFNSISLDPPLVLWSLSCNAYGLPGFQGAGYFAVNVLSANQVDLAINFAMPIAEKFAGMNVLVGRSGVPLLEGVVARFVCRKQQEYLGGDHVIFTGLVEDYDCWDRVPLISCRGQYECLHLATQTAGARDPGR